VGIGRGIGVKIGAPKDCNGTSKCGHLSTLFSRISNFCRHKVANSNTGRRFLAIYRNYLVSFFARKYHDLMFGFSLVPLSIYNNIIT